MVAITIWYPMVMTTASAFVMTTMIAGASSNNCTGALKNTFYRHMGQEVTVPADSADACCASCVDATPPCVAWTFHKETCIYGTAKPKHVSNKTGAISWSRAPPPTPPPVPPPANARNVLFIVIDDLRDEVGFLNNRTNESTLTPRMDALARSSTVFTRAYVQIAVCSPSRNSFLSGRRPDTTKVWNFENSFRETLGYANVTSMPQAFKANGWNTVGLGKVYHPGHPVSDDVPYSWSSPWQYYHPNDADIVGRGCHGANATRGTVVENAPGLGWSSCDGVADGDYEDGNIVDHALQRLDDLASRPSPFFLAVGLHVCTHARDNTS